MIDPRHFQKMTCFIRMAMLLMGVLFPGASQARQAAEKPLHEKVERKAYTIQSTGRKVWVYYPKGEISGKLPCVLIGAAGSRMFHGMDLVEADSAEHYPYAEQGFAVVAYEISGPLNEEDLDNADAIEKAAAAFVKSNGGVEDAKAALAYSASRHPIIDLTRVYAVGHSSAATVALTLAQSPERIRGCVAYAPVVDLTGVFTKTDLAEFEKAGVKLGEYFKSASPLQNIQKLRCPLFLFNAKDDSAVSPSAIREYAAKVKREKKECDYKEVETGEHYESMIKEGIPAGIAWLKKLDSALR